MDAVAATSSSLACTSASARMDLRRESSKWECMTSSGMLDSLDRSSAFDPRRNECTEADQMAAWASRALQSESLHAARVRNRFAASAWVSSGNMREINCATALGMPSKSGTSTLLLGWLDADGEPAVSSESSEMEPNAGTVNLCASTVPVRLSMEHKFVARCIASSTISAASSQASAPARSDRRTASVPMGMSEGDGCPGGNANPLSEALSRTTVLARSEASR